MQETEILIIGGGIAGVSTAWQLAQFGHDVPLAETSWPRADESMLVEETVTVAVQVNGKLRGTVDLPVDADRDVAESLALALDKVKLVIDGKQPRKIIVVPNKIVNVVL